MEDPATHRTGRSFWRGFPHPQPWCVLIFVVIIVIIVIIVVVGWCRPCCEEESDPASGDPGTSGGVFEDVIETPYATHEVVALIDGTQTGCLNDLPSGPFLSKSVGLGNFTGGCGTEPAAAALFSKDRRARFMDPGWTTSYDKVVESPATSAVDDAPVVVRLRIWRGVTQDLASPPNQIDLTHFLNAVAADVDITNDIYNESRAGIEFDFVIDEVVDLVGDVDEPDFLAACDAILYGSGPPSFWGHSIDPQYLEVIFVREGGWVGVVCDRNRDTAGNVVPDGIADGVILIDYFERHDGTVLAHELGHAVGLLPPVGHVNNYAGFDETNVMWPQWAAIFPDERDHFTLGQVYRMNIDSHSWRVIKHDPPGVMCQRSPDVNDDDPCPWLRQELDYVP